MSEPGWYPDPNGTPGRFRYWDGATWSRQTASRPGPTPPRSTGRRGGMIILGAAVLVVVLGVIIVVTVRQAGLGSRAFTDQDLPSSTDSGWDDSSPSPSPTPSPSSTPSPSPSPAITPGPSGTSTAALTECPHGSPSTRADHPRDGRMHGGGLSFPHIDGWNDDLQSSEISWAHDVASQGRPVVPGWVTLVAVGELRESDGFTAPKQAAESVMQCLASSDWYEDAVSTTALKSQTRTVDGHRAWWIRSEIRVEHRPVEGDTVDVIVVDTGHPGSFGLFLGDVALHHPDLLAIMDDTTRRLTVD